MSPILARIIATLLIPCLLTDPVLSSVRVSPLSPIPRLSQPQTLFHQQALISTLVGAQRYSFTLKAGTVGVGAVVVGLIGAWAYHPKWAGPTSLIGAMAVQMDPTSLRGRIRELALSGLQVIRRIKARKIARELGYDFDSKTGRLRLRADHPPIPDLNVWHVRHGKTPLNEKAVLQGQIERQFSPEDDFSSVKLSEAGVRDAEDAAETLWTLFEDLIQAGKFVIVVHSPLIRSKQTADIFIQLVKKRAPNARLVVLMNEWAMEMNFGEWENTPRPQLDAKTQSRLDALIKHQDVLKGSYSGETFLDVVKRQHALRDYLAQQIQITQVDPKTPIIVFGHGVQGNALMTALGTSKVFDEQGYYQWRELVAGQPAQISGEPLIAAARPSAVHDEMLQRDPGTLTTMSRQALRAYQGEHPHSFDFAIYAITANLGNLFRAFGARADVTSAGFNVQRAGGVEYQVSCTVDFDNPNSDPSLRISQVERSEEITLRTITFKKDQVVLSVSRAGRSKIYIASTDELYGYFSDNPRIVLGLDADGRLVWFTNAQFIETVRQGLRTGSGALIQAAELPVSLAPFEQTEEWPSALAISHYNLAAGSLETEHLARNSFVQALSEFTDVPAGEVAQRLYFSAVRVSPSGIHLIDALQTAIIWFQLGLPDAVYSQWKDQKPTAFGLGDDRKKKALIIERHENGLWSARVQPYDQASPGFVRLQTSQVFYNVRQHLPNDAVLGQVAQRPSLHMTWWEKMIRSYLGEWSQPQWLIDALVSLTEPGMLMIAGQYTGVAGIVFGFLHTGKSTFVKILAMAWGLTVITLSLNGGIDSVPGYLAVASVQFLITTLLARPLHLQSMALPRLRALIVEDNPSDAEIVKNYLKADGYEVVIAPTFSEGRRKVLGAIQEGQPFSRIISDMDLHYSHTRLSFVHVLDGFWFVLWSRWFHPEIKEVTFHSREFNDRARLIVRLLGILFIARAMGAHLQGKTTILGPAGLKSRQLAAA